MVEEESKGHGQRFLTSFGAMQVTMSYMPCLDQTILQHVNKFMYKVGVSRVQTTINLTPPVYFLTNVEGANRNHVIKLSKSLGAIWKVEYPI